MNMNQSHTKMMGDHTGAGAGIPISSLPKKNRALAVEYAGQHDKGVVDISGLHNILQSCVKEKDACKRTNFRNVKLATLALLQAVVMFGAIFLQQKEERAEGSTEMMAVQPARTTRVREFPTKMSSSTSSRSKKRRLAVTNSAPGTNSGSLAPRDPYDEPWELSCEEAAELLYDCGVLDQCDTQWQSPLDGPYGPCMCETEMEVTWYENVPESCWDGNSDQAACEADVCTTDGEGDDDDLYWGFDFPLFQRHGDGHCFNDENGDRSCNVHLYPAGTPNPDAGDGDGDGDGGGGGGDGAGASVASGGDGDGSGTASTYPSATLWRVQGDVAPATGTWSAGVELYDDNDIRIETLPFAFADNGGGSWGGGYGENIWDLSSPVGGSWTGGYIPVGEVGYPGNRHGHLTDAAMSTTWFVGELSEPAYSQAEWASPIMVKKWRIYTHRAHYAGGSFFLLFSTDSGVTWTQHSRVDLAGQNGQPAFENADGHYWLMFVMMISLF
jgi:hypothetical protein